MDGYMAGSYNELFEEDHIRVKEIIDYNTGYGIVLGGIHNRLQRCFKNYAKRKRSYIVNYVASQIHTVKVSFFTTKTSTEKHLVCACLPNYKVKN